MALDRPAVLDLDGGGYFMLTGGYPSPRTTITVNNGSDEVEIEIGITELNWIENALYNRKKNL